MSDEDLSVTVRDEEEAVIVEVTGAVDLTTVAPLRESLFEQAERGRPLIVDLNRVTFMDSAGLGVLIGASRRTDGAGGSLHAVCSRPQTRKLLWLTGVDRRIPLSATLDGALSLVTAARE
jgi:anti-anti-sigma factor